MFSQLHFSHISHHLPFISSWKWNQSWQAACWPRAPSRRACRGSPEHRYIKACPCRPGIDRGLQINTHIADEHAKKLSETSVSLNSTVFKLCCPAHLFPNTPRNCVGRMALSCQLRIVRFVLFCQLCVGGIALSCQLWICGFVLFCQLCVEE